MNLKREKLELSPVFSTALVHENHKLGYIKLTSFSQKAAADMRRHINKLEASLYMSLYLSKKPSWSAATAQIRDLTRFVSLSGLSNASEWTIAGKLT